MNGIQTFTNQQNMSAQQQIQEPTKAQSNQTSQQRAGQQTAMNSQRDQKERLTVYEQMKLERGQTSGQQIHREQQPTTTMANKAQDKRIQAASQEPNRFRNIGPTKINAVDSLHTTEAITPKQTQQSIDPIERITLMINFENKKLDETNNRINLAINEKQKTQFNLVQLQKQYSDLMNAKQQQRDNQRGSTFLFTTTKACALDGGYYPRARMEDLAKGGVNKAEMQPQQNAPQGGYYPAQPRSSYNGMLIPRSVYKS